MKTTRKTDLAKFFCGFETFHALMHGELWFSGTSVPILGIMATPTWNMIGSFLNAAIAVILGMYAWSGRPTTAPPPAAG